MAAAVWMRQPAGKTLAVIPFLLMAVAYGVTALLWAPTLALIGAALGGPSTLVIAMFVFLVLFGLFAPLFEVTTPKTRQIVLVATAASGMVLLLAVRLVASHDSSNRRPNSLFYTLDADTDEALWVSLDAAPSPWSSQFLSATPERGSLPAFVGRPRPALTASAPVASLGEAKVELLSEEARQGARHLELSVGWPWDVHKAMLFLRSEGEIRGISIGGERFERLDNVGPGDAASRMILIYFAPPSEGIRFDVEMTGDEPIEIEAVGQQYALPRLAGFSYEPRPDHLMPTADWSTDSTFVRSVTTVTRGAPAPEEATAAPDDGAEADRVPAGSGEGAASSP